MSNYYHCGDCLYYFDCPVEDSDPICEMFEERDDELWKEPN